MHTTQIFSSDLGDIRDPAEYGLEVRGAWTPVNTVVAYRASLRCFTVSNNAGNMPDVPYVIRKKRLTVLGHGSGYGRRAMRGSCSRGTKTMGT